MIWHQKMRKSTVIGGIILSALFFFRIFLKYSFKNTIKSRVIFAEYLTLRKVKTGSVLSWICQVERLAV